MCPKKRSWGEWVHFDFWIKTILSMSSTTKNLPGYAKNEKSKDVFKWMIIADISSFYHFTFISHEWKTICSITTNLTKSNMIMQNKTNRSICPRVWSLYRRLLQ